MKIQEITEMQNKVMNPKGGSSSYYPQNSGRGGGSNKRTMRGRQQYTSGRNDNPVDYFSNSQAQPSNKGGWNQERFPGQYQKSRKYQPNYEEHVEKSGDEDLERYEYDKINRGKRDVNQSNIVDYFESGNPQENSEKSRSRSRSYQRSGGEDREKIVDMFNDLNTSEKPSIIYEPEVKPIDNIESEEEFLQSMAKHKEDQMNLLMRNAQQSVSKQQKKPKKKQQKDVLSENRITVNFDSGKTTDDGTGMDWKSRITGAIVEDYQKPGKRREKTFHGVDSSFSDSKKSHRLIKTKFVGLTEKFEYGKMLRSGNDMFRVHQILKRNDQGGKIQFDCDQEELNKVAGFGHQSDMMAETQKEMLMQYFQLFGMYTSHYSSFKDRRILVIRHADGLELYLRKQHGETKRRQSGRLF